MNNKQISTICFLAGAILLIISFVVYSDNAANVNAINQLGMGGIVKMKPATPMATIICGLIGLGALITGMVFLSSDKPK